MDNLVSTHPMDTQTDKVTLANGYWFYFNDEDRHFAVHGSGYSGKETVYLNDELVSSTRNYRTVSRHQFEIGSDRYRVEYHVTSILRGEINCSLYKNGRCLHRETKAYSPGSTKDALKKLGLFFIGGMVFGAIAGVIAAVVFGQQRGQYGY